MIRISLTRDFLASTVLTPGTLSSCDSLAAGRDQVVRSFLPEPTRQPDGRCGIGCSASVSGESRPPELDLLPLIVTAGIMLDAGSVGAHRGFAQALEGRPLHLARLGDFSKQQASRLKAVIAGRGRDPSGCRILGTWGHGTP